MKYRLLDNLKAKTPSGVMELQAGQVITLPKDTAYELLKAGRITPIEVLPVKVAEPLRYAVKIYSHILGGYLWVVQDADDWPHLKESGEPVYDSDEIKELKSKGLTPDELKAVHNIKSTFRGTVSNDDKCL